ncbi:alpha-1,3-galactosidase [Anopheles sinensis]|uniref:Alpha-1,3-galactosidase n=1 Tax=Anopheles sinensis TaxID=74873 RepID=A0A084VI33_ANOSI|nr:alpha-1,3-galactosidase [Anopheles sinensis]
MGAPTLSNIITMLIVYVPFVGGMGKIGENAEGFALRRSSLAPSGDEFMASTLGGLLRAGGVILTNVNI